MKACSGKFWINELYNCSATQSCRWTRDTCDSVTSLLKHQSRQWSTSEILRSRRDRTRHKVQDGKNDSCCLLLLALSPQFAVSVMWIGYVIVYFSGQSTRSRAVELTYVTNCSLWKRMMAWERKLPSKGLWDIFRETLKVSMPKHVRCCVPLCTNNFVKLLAHRLGDIARLQQLRQVSMAVG